MAGGGREKCYSVYAEASLASDRSRAREANSNRRDAAPPVEPRQRLQPPRGIETVGRSRSPKRASTLRQGRPGNQISMSERKESPVVQKNRFNFDKRIIAVIRRTDQTFVGWTEDNVATLRQLYDEGHSFTVIGRRLKTTKDAAHCKAKRLGFPPRGSPIHARPSGSPPKSPARAGKSTLPPLPSLKGP